ncbi:hypothetical protein BpHYR1_042711 [Brachionus plicatilis]|uniref:Uncharacterized protein n=1 Tax=Brachionus plicatilis TaxID=10195 RepID=A0A3M7Q2U5_BRAPC|nr:hypothetical protein BpHYR1_042711 [Brachionus plicatilis]
MKKRVFKCVLKNFGQPITNVERQILEVVLKKKEVVEEPDETSSETVTHTNFDSIGDETFEFSNQHKKSHQFQN